MDQHPDTLHVHAPRPHAHQNANAVHAQEQAKGTINDKIAVWLTAYVGTMWTAYGFTALALVGLFGVLAILNPTVYTLVAWLSQTLIQLVLLPVIMVGQNVLGRKSEIQNDEMFHNTANTLHDAEQQMQHLDAQDVHILAIERQHGDKLDRILAAVAPPPEPEKPKTPPKPRPSRAKKVSLP